MMETKVKDAIDLQIEEFQRNPYPAREEFTPEKTPENEAYWLDGEFQHMSYELKQPPVQHKKLTKKQIAMIMAAWIVPCAGFLVLAFLTGGL